MTIRLALAALVLAAVGCGSTDRPTGASPRADAQAEEAAIRANLAKLSPEDRQLAEAQKFCAVETENRLGTMGVPVKVTLQDQAVFLCCKSCRRQAEADPDATLARVRKRTAEPIGAPGK